VFIFHAGMKTVHWSEPRLRQSLPKYLGKSATTELGINTLQSPPRGADATPLAYFEWLAISRSCSRSKRRHALSQSA
jgi:hypothetical protein